MKQRVSNYSDQHSQLISTVFSNNSLVLMEGHFSQHNENHHNDTKYNDSQRNETQTDNKNLAQLKRHTASTQLSISALDTKSSYTECHGPSV